VDNIQGDVDINLSHGQIMTEELGGRSRIEVAHGQGGRILGIKEGRLNVRHYQRLRVGELGKVNLDVAHSSLEVEKSADLDAEIRHSKFEIESTGKVLLTSGHSNLDFGDVISLMIEMEHSDIEIEQVAETIEAHTSHSQLRVRKIPQGFEMVDLDGSHSFFSINVEQQASFAIDVRLNHGRMRYDSDEIPINYVDVQNNTSRYKSKIGEGDGTIRVVNQHGDFRINLVD